MFGSQPVNLLETGQEPVNLLCQFLFCLVFTSADPNWT